MTESAKDGEGAALATSAVAKEQKKLEILKTRRLIFTKQMNRIHDFLSDIDADTLIAEFEVRLEALESSFKAFQQIQIKVEELDPKESISKVDVRADYEEMYYKSRSKILHEIQCRKITSRAENVVSVQNKSSSQLKLPKLNIPIFSGEVTQWLSFYEIFNSLIHNNPTLSNVSKLHYLISSLSGQAARTVQSLEITEDNYDVALGLLIENYDNKRLITTEHIKKIMMYPPLRKPSSASLRQFCDEINSHLRALTTLGRPVSQWDDLLIQILLPKLDSFTLNKWNEEGPTERMPSLQELLKFLTRRSQIIMDDNTQASTSIHAKNNQGFRVKTFSIQQPNKNNENSCLFCKKSNHNIYKCYQFSNLPLAQRQMFVDSNQLCINCLKSNHDANNCTASKCRKCSNSHHTLLHSDSTARRPLGATSPHSPHNINYTANAHTPQLANTSCSSKTSPMQQQYPQSYHLYDESSTDSPDLQVSTTRTILATAIVFALDKQGSPIPCRVLLDSASHVNLTTERFANLLGIRRKNTKTSIHGIGQNTLFCKHEVNLTVKSHLNNFTKDISALIVTKISGFLPDTRINESNLPIPANINLADPMFGTPNRVDLLIGAEHFFTLLSIGQIKLGLHLPTLQNTVFGWVVSGSVEQRRNNNTFLSAHAIKVEENNDIAGMLKAFWEIESHESLRKPFTKSENLCEEHFIEHVRRTENGRIEVKLPFKQDPLILGNSYATALQRFYTLERKLKKDPNLAAQYVEFMKEYKQLAHMEEVAEHDFRKPHYFIPHHGISKPESSTTKLRVVFDASAKCDNGVSLNDILFVGPVVQPDLFTSIIKFRSHNFVFTADVTKMYRQIALNEHDRAYHQILWRASPEEELKIFRLCTVTYGTASASFLATRSLLYLAEKENDRFPIGALVLREDFYVDDVLTGANTLKELEHKKRELEGILKSGGLQLKKWCSNNDRLLHDISIEDREPLFQLNNNDVVKTLGVVWDPKVDTLFYKAHSIDRKSITKRTVLADIASLYDPLGLINPVIVLSKIFMQSLWKQGFEWDEALPQSEFQMWQTFRMELSDLNQISIERQAMWGDVQRVQLHAFSDSSEKAYGTCLYLRSTLPNGRVRLQLLCAKSKVAPVKNVCLPRLELCAAQMMAQLVSRVRHIFGDKFEDVYYWTDSSIVLAWLSSESYHFQTFVANRVAMIQSLSCMDKWRHVGTKNNPADIISRGSFPSELKNSKLWFHGPEFLHLAQENWPNFKASEDKIDEGLLERKETRCNFSIQINNDFLLTMKYNNNYQKMLRVTAYILRFGVNALSNHRGEMKTRGPLTVSEMDKAMHCILKMIQRSTYASDIERLEQKGIVSPRSHISSLSPFLDANGILRVGGRICNANIAFQHKHPALLPNNHVFTVAFIKYKHEKHHHVGVQGLLSIIREQFWPVHAKPLIRRVVNRCVLCARASPRFEYPRMGNLPECRVLPSRPFTTVGTDFCGPFLVHSRRRGTAAVKAYVAVFICLSTKAVHFELVGDLTTASFLGALRRFISRRGLCRTIYSDNATNYIGSRNELRSLYEMFHNQQSTSEIMKTCLNDGIEWKNIPPRSPHFGGIWEAAVKSAKHHMKRLLHLAALTYEELNTLIIQIECILNSRPLSPLSEDPNDLNPLTPGHFLTGTSLIALPEPDLCNRNISYLTRWQRVQWLMQQFWHRWKNEYLHTLQQRNKWRNDSTGLQLNDIVIIKDDNIPPLKWKLGRIIERHLGKDGIVRVVTLKTAGGLLKRATANLCRLPVVEAPQGLQEGEHVQTTLPN